LKRRLAALAKLAVSVSIVAYLVIDVQRSDPGTFTRLATEPKDWTLLFFAWTCFVAALVLGWMRWRALARVLGIEMRPRDAARLGFFGYLLDFLALGTMGGDLGRGVLLGREHDRHWAEALASVAADRLVGLWALSLAAAVGVAFAHSTTDSPELARIARAVFAVAASTSLELGLLLMPRVREGILETLLHGVPRLGQSAARMLDALRPYRERSGVLLGIGVLSLGVPILNVAGFFLVARGLPLDAPSLLEHFVIVPPAMIAGAIPLPMEALGVFEYVLNFLYAQSSPAEGAAGAGLLVALTYRALTILTIVAGAPLYAWARAER
jgi:uncharacterized protein (TIRG00374 family)